LPVRRPTCQPAETTGHATLALSHGRLFPPADRLGVEQAMDATLRQVVVTGVGHWRGEGMALVEAAT